VRPGDIVIVNTGWHHKYADSAEYYAYSPGFYKEAGEWFVAKGVKAVGTDAQALDHPLATAIGRMGRLRPPAGSCPGPVASTRRPARRWPMSSPSGSRAIARS
jgi:kynurenine formamidase